MPWTNYHTHSNFCDGKGELREYAEAAVQQGMKSLGFSCHAPLPFDAWWAVKSEKIKDYCNTVLALKEEFQNKLTINLGLEIDYIPGVVGPGSAIYKDLGLEYKIGSLHFTGHDQDGSNWFLNGRGTIFEDGVRDNWGGDIRPLVELYYKITREMLTKDCPDILGHLDDIKRFNISGKYFSESEKWYQDAILETLDVIKKSGVIMEVNAGRTLREASDNIYPSKWIMERSLELGIPITLNSDAHAPKNVASLFEKVAASLSDVGYKELYYLSSDGWIPASFTSDGMIFE